MTEPIKLPPMEIFDKGTWVWKGQEFTGAELDAAAFAKYRLAVEQNTAELLKELTTLQRWYAACASGGADVTARAEKAEAEVEKLRAALGAMVDTSRKHVTDMDDEEAAAFWAAWKVLDEVALKETK